MSLSGRLALVTGAASGIGEAVCRVLAEEGTAVVVADKQLEAARQVVASLPGDAKHQAVYVDVGDSASVKHLFDNIKDTYAALPLSTVVNCAGIGGLVPILDCSDEIFDDFIRVNLKGTFLVTREASRYMLRSGQPMPEGGAAIVNVASIFGKSGQENAAAYSASKGGVVAMTKSAAQELAPHGIRCNAVLPGWTETPMTALVPKDMRAEAIASTPLKRTAQPREIAEAIKFLCSPTSSSFVTGAALEVTGGWRM
ncbi:estradiol 17-beta-dehydrogenase 8 [Rhipicephalus sanguineus]|uniref:estradiol 17-beta-dehydrogenase 8 n=1 Tax=Rhipicephalus sanguineus TaxID=34632 RepID=UPI001893C916|nr:estradiol 17-beta-dehydrogenase 8 [Rhipicephalus sanguineus]